MKFWNPYGALSRSPSTSPLSGGGSIEATLQQFRKDSRWRRALLGTLSLFACSYVLVIFLSGGGCAPSSIGSYSSGETDGTSCWIFPSRFTSFLPSASETSTASSIPVPDRNSSQASEIWTSIDRIVFGIGGNDESWTERREYIKLWWKPGVTRGFVWVDQNLTNWERGDPPFKVSEDTSRFSYTHPENSRSALRIARIVLESFRLGLPSVDWFVLGDDDTLFFAENLVKVLSKYDPRKMHYIGTNSEDTRQSERHHYGLAFGGGGLAISYPLAKALSDFLDDCMERYAWLYGSDERVKACVSELGVPMTKEPGFHQLDIRGDISGFLAAHPVSPVVSLHHLNDMSPIFYGPNHLDDLKRLMKAVAIDPASMFQQSICYSSEKQWSFSVAWGYVVEVYEGFLTPRELEMPARTFTSWAWVSEFGGFTFDTRPLPNVCDRPTRFFMSTAESKNSRSKRTGVSSYKRHVESEQESCSPKSAPLATVKSLTVEKQLLSDDWYQNPQRQCCTVTQMKSKSIKIRVGACGESESLVDGAKVVETKSRRLLVELPGLGDFTF